MGTGGEVFSLPLQVASCQFPGHCGCTEWDPVSNTTAWSGASNVLRPVLSFGGHRVRGCDYWVLGRGWTLSRHSKEQELAHPHLFPGGEAAAKAGVTIVYLCTQTKHQMLFLAHDPEEQRRVTVILLFLTTIANLTPISLGCHENLPREKYVSWKVLFLTS